MTVREVAEAFTTLLKEGRDEEAGARFWADGVVSIEAMEGPMARLEGPAALIGKRDWWFANHEVHGASAAGPFVNGDCFTVVFDMDITVKETGQRMQMQEVGLYTVKDGKVVEERFFY
jgi:ketosteroid isomerase-like protein